MQFDWDPAKAKANLAKHRVSFETAKLVFQDRFAIVEPDDEPSEERWAADRDGKKCTAVRGLHRAGSCGPNRRAIDICTTGNEGREASL